MDVVRDGAAGCAAAAADHERLPRRRGLLRLRRAGRAAARRGVARCGARGRRRGAVRPRAEPVRFLVVAAHHARERRPEPQLPRLQQAAAAQRRPTTQIAHLLVPADLAAAGRSGAGVAEGLASSKASAHCRRRCRAGSTSHPEGLFYGGATRPGATQTLRQVLRDHGQRCARLGWIDLHTGLGPERPRRAHLRRPR